MDKRHVVLYIAAAGILIGVPGCGERNRTDAGIAQTGFPGQVTAGGGTGGEVVARSPQSVKEGTYAGGTPGIAGGSGGNVGGAATGGSVQETGRGPTQGVTPPGTQAPLPGQTQPQAQTEAQTDEAKKAQAAAKAEKEKQLMAASMDAVAVRWRANAAAEGRQTNPPTPVAAPAAAIAMPATQSSPSGQPGGQLGPAAKAAPVKSEKAGTAPPPADAKKPAGGAPGS